MHRDDTPTPSRVLLTAPSWIGDVVMATPSFRAIRERFGEAHLTVLIRRNARPVIDDAAWFDEVIEVTPDDRGLRGTFRLGRRLRQGNYDLGVLLTNSFRTALMMRLARVGRIVGYRRDFRRLLLTDALEAPRAHGRFVPVPARDYYLALCRHLGCDVSNRRMTLFYRPDILHAFEAFARRRGIDGSRRIVVMNPGASFGSSKCWPVEHFARAADMLVAEEPDVQVVVICAPAERELARAVADLAETDVVSLDVEPAGLALLKVIIDRAALLITNDTGPRHYAAAFETPIVTIFGATDPRWSDTGFDAERIVRIDVDCAPCQRKRCPIDHRCMRWLKPEMVVEAARDLLRRFPKEDR